MEYKGEKLIFEDLIYIFFDYDKLKYVGGFFVYVLGYWDWV